MESVAEQFRWELGNIQQVPSVFEISEGHLILSYCEPVGLVQMS